MPADLPTVLRTLDRLAPQPGETLQAVLDATASAGWPTTAAQASEALMAVTQPAPPPSVTAPDAGARPSRWVRLRRAVGSWLTWEGTGLMAMVGSAGLAKQVYGPVAVQTMVAPAFSGLVLLVLGMGMAAHILRGTWATARDGEVLAENWLSFWTPIRLSLASLWVMPLLGAGLSPLGYLLKAFWG